MGKASEIKFDGEMELCCVPCTCGHFEKLFMSDFELKTMKIRLGICFSAILGFQILLIKVFQSKFEKFFMKFFFFIEQSRIKNLGESSDPEQI